MFENFVFIRCRTFVSNTKIIKIQHVVRLRIIRLNTDCMLIGFNCFSVVSKIVITISYTKIGISIAGIFLYSFFKEFKPFSQSSAKSRASPDKKGPSGVLNNSSVLGASHLSKVFALTGLSFSILQPDSKVYILSFN